MAPGEHDGARGGGDYRSVGAPAGWRSAGAMPPGGAGGRHAGWHRGCRPRARRRTRGLRRGRTIAVDGPRLTSVSGFSGLRPEVATAIPVPVSREQRASDQMDFTFSADQDALPRRGARLPRQRGAGALRAGDGRRRARLHRRAVAHASPRWAGRACSCPRSTAVSGSGSSTWSSCMEEMGRLPFPGPFFSSAVLATLAARRLGADDLLAALASGTLRGTVALEESGHGDPGRPGAHAGPAQGRDLDRQRRRSPSCSTATPPTGRSSSPAPRRGSGSFLLQAPPCEAVPTLDPTRKAARLVLDDTPGRADRPARRPHRRSGAASSTTRR